MKDGKQVYIVRSPFSDCLIDEARIKTNRKGKLVLKFYEKKFVKLFTKFITLSYVAWAGLLKNSTWASALNSLSRPCFIFKMRPKCFQISMLLPVGIFERAMHHGKRFPYR